MTREEVKVELAGLTHDHLMINNRQQSQQEVGQNHQQQTGNNALSTIAILRRHPMYDCLVLRKRYRACLNGFTLEFPTNSVTSATTSETKNCCKTKLVSVYLDGDDPIYLSQENKSKTGLLTQHDNEKSGEMVYVPMNGLLTRLDNYDRHGIAIDSRVYAFAMGLKTAEKFLTTSSMKEIQETPPF